MALESILAPAPTRPRREAPSRGQSTTERQRARRQEHAPRRLAIRRPAPRLDRIVRGRAWIPVLGVMLVAIVGLRVEVLKLGSSVGRQLAQATTLQSANALLRSQVSALSDNQRIEGLAAGMGMVMPGPLDVHFVKSSAGRRVGAAIRAISAPSTSSFLSSLANERQADPTIALAAANSSAIGVLGGGTTTGSAGTTATTNASSTASTASSTTSIASGSTAASTSGAAYTPSSTSAGTSSSTAGTSSTTGAGATGATSSGSTASGTSAGTAGSTATSTSGGSTSGGSTGSNAGAGSPPPAAQTSGTAPGSTTGGGGLAG